MISIPIPGVKLFPKLSGLFTQTRNIRPIIRIGKEKFELTVDVRQFNKNEIRVKARPEYVIVEGKQERQAKNGYIIRQFVRKFKLPDGCSPETMASKLSPDGMLTITAPRKVYPPNLPCETCVPITYDEPSKIRTVNIEEKKMEDICRQFKKPTTDEKKAGK